MAKQLDPRIRQVLARGTVIPAHPLALTAQRRLDERGQRALTRYYLAAGAGGLAVGVHTTQFAIHDPAVGLLRPVLELTAEQLRRCQDGAVPSLKPGSQTETSGVPESCRTSPAPSIAIAGICGPTRQA